MKNLVQAVAWGTLIVLVALWITKNEATKLNAMGIETAIEYVQSKAAH